MPPTLLAYHGKASIKAKYLKRVEKHREADEIAKGFYWESGRGCAVGCTLHSSEHSEYEKQLGIPESIAHLEDAIFEALPLERAKLWPGQFLRAVKPGADLSLVTKRFIAFTTRELADAASTKAKPICTRLADLIDRSLAGDEPSPAQWDKAARDAWAAWAAWGAWTAWDARDARDVWAAWAAWAASAAWDARDARDARAAWAAWAAWDPSRHAEKLLELLRTAPIPGK